VTTLAAPASPLSVGSVAQLTLSLAAIVALIFAVSWVVKRLKLGAPRGGRGEIDAQVLVGIGAGGVVGLTPLDKPIAVKTSPEQPAFADRLREFMKRPGGPA
jgi:hypothetical protein